eukprot:TRINITY_DN8624_c0_g1_i1.p1 TRINITY_DN8624_c0_g1~~TRINITY_DN8624_c0_g1_i1.p1  ORF type:complete len:100 (+),score=17.23 TRINITY_DN8624_c0_g1_i1:52-351(+)
MFRFSTALSQRKLGVVMEWRKEKGWGYLCDMKNRDMVHVHRSNVKGQSADRRGMAINQVVEYELSETGTTAVNVTGVGGSEVIPAIRHAFYDGAGAELY